MHTVGAHIIYIYEIVLRHCTKYPSNIEWRHNSAQQTAQATGLAELFCSSIDMTASDFIDETQNDDVGIIAMTQWEGKMGNDLDLIDARNEAGARYIWRNPQNRNQEVTKAKFLELMSLPIREGGWGLKLKTGNGSIINLYIKRN